MTPDIFIATEDDGSQWVALEDYNKLKDQLRKADATIDALKTSLERLCRVADEVIISTWEPKP
jgi:hypothetical protein